MLDAAKLFLGFDTNAGKGKLTYLRFDPEKINLFPSCITWDGYGLRPDSRIYLFYLSIIFVKNLPHNKSQNHHKGGQ